MGLFAVLRFTGIVKLGYGWGELTSMTLPTGGLFMLLGSAYAARAWSLAELRLAMNRRLLAGFGLGLALFVALSIMSDRSARELAETDDWVRHTHEVLARIQKVNADLITVQSAVGGFVIAGREDFLAPYDEARRELEDDEPMLRRLTADNPRQQQRLTTLEDLIRQRLANSEETLDLQRRRGFAAAAALIAAGGGLQIMKKFAAVIAALEREEQDLLTRRQARAGAQTARTFFVLSIGTFISLALLLMVLFFLNSEATERREAEATSRLGAEIVRSASDAVMTKTLEGVITSWNSGAEAIFGYTAKEAIGRPVLMFVPPECAAEEAEILAKIGRGERVDHFETVRVRKDGRRANVSVTVSPLKDDSGRIFGAVKILRDITERKQSEEALRASEERFRTMANSIPQLTWTARADGYIDWCNKRWYEYTGTTPEQVEGWAWQIVHDPDVLPRVMRIWRGAINSGQPFEMEFPLRGSDGKFRTFLTRVSPFKDAEGRVVQWFGTNTDVDELKRVEESLRASQAQLNSALAAGSIGTWTWDIVNDRLTGDEFIARMFAIEPAAAAKGLPAEVYLRAVMKEDQPPVAAALARAVQSCGRYDIEYRVRQENGGLHWLQAKGRVEGDAAGKALRLHGAVMDITEHKRTEGRFRRLVDSNAQGVMFWNKKGEITEANDALLRIVGYSREDQRAGRMNWAAMTPPEHAHLDQRSLNELAAEGICTPFEKEFIRKDGSRVPVFLGAATFEDSPDEGVCFVIDITDRKRTDLALRESEEHFRFLNELSLATRTLAEPGPIMAVTERMLGEHLAVSRCAYADVGQDGEHFSILHDYTAGRPSAVGNYPLSLLGPRAVSMLQAGQTLIIRDLEAEVSPGGGPDMVHPMGSKAMIVCPIVKDGRLRAMLAVSQTTPREWKPLEIVLVQNVVERCWALVERATAEENIRRLNDELEQRVVERTAQLAAANLELEAFSYSVSHDLRAPLRTMDGFSQALTEDYGQQLPEEGRHYLRTIRHGAERMATLIDDLLEFARLSRQSLHNQAIDTQRLVREVIADLAPQREGRQIEIRTNDLPPCRGDRALLKQVWVNLVSNAFKYTRKSERAVVEIGCVRENNENVYFIRDNGTGFDMKYAHKLFGVFQRLHRAEDYEGTGVGLAIVQRVIHRHGGRIWAEAALEKGAAFYFTLKEGAK
jgi:PAS domain S-box-containing protein